MDIMLNKFQDNANKCVRESFFLDDLKRVEVILLFKKDKDSKTSKENYRPVLSSPE